MRILGAVCLALTAMAAGPAAPDPRIKNEVERLMNGGLPFAEQMLRDHGEFYPFGAVMMPDGLIRAVGADDDRNQPPVDEVLLLLLRSLREGAEAGAFNAAAVFTNVRVPHPSEDRRIAAIHVGLEHRAGYCIDVFFPYEIEAGAVKLGESFGAPREGTVFATCR